MKQEDSNVFAVEFPKEVDPLDELEEAFLRCRAYGHSWDEYSPNDRRSIFRDEVHLRCVRCHTERHDAESLTGDIIARQYEYPIGYKLAGMVPRSEFRLALRRRRK